MANVVAECGGIRLEAKSAIVIYATDGHASSERGGCVTMHTIDQRGELGPGTPLDVATLYETLVAALHGVDGFFINERILFASPNQLVWWTPAARRPLFITPKEGKSRLSGKDYNHPTLLFRAARDRVFVWALRNTGRPGLDDPVFQAPYLNVYDDGSICTGQIKWPKFPTPAVLTEYERLFFDSIGTHATARRLTRHAKGFDGYWLAARKGNPHKWLLRTGQTVKAICNNERRT